MCKVVNKNKSEFDVLITRGTIWGNRFAAGSHSGRAENRDEVIAAFRRQLTVDIQNGQITVAMLAALDGKRLGCVCKPKACHGDVIAEYVAWAVNQLEKG